MAGHRRGAPGSGASTQLTERELRQLLRYCVIGLGLVDAAHGLGYALGSPASAPSLQLMAAFAPLWVWGLVLAAAGLCLLIGRFYILGFALGGFITFVWAVFSFAVVVNHTATGWGWPWPLGYAGVHFAAAWVRGQLNERRRRSEEQAGEP